jgi:hypothetical protein
MPNESQSVWEILVLRKYNDGRRVHLRHHRVWDAKVKAIANCITILVPRDFNERIDKELRMSTWGTWQLIKIGIGILIFIGIWALMLLGARRD